MKVSEVMTTEVETVQMNSTLEEAASIMKVENVGAIPVVDEDDDLVGIITDRDIVVRCVAEGKDPSDTSVVEVLSHELETIEPDVDVEEAARLMADKGQIEPSPVREATAPSRRNLPFTRGPSRESIDRYRSSGHSASPARDGPRSSVRDRFA